MVTARRDYSDSTPKPRQIREVLKLSRERMGRLMDVSSKTIERWEERESFSGARAVSDRLMKLNQIIELGEAVYTTEGLRRFLTAPLPEFDGHTALRLIELGQAERVLAALVADYEGLGY
jgi:transcriptional regulator with XRE-family HTH domain